MESLSVRDALSAAEGDYSGKERWLACVRKAPETKGMCRNERNAEKRPVSCFGGCDAAGHDAGTCGCLR